MGQVIQDSPAAEPRFKARGVDKHFGPVQALTNLDLALADNLDIVQNMFLGRERMRNVFLNEDDMERAASKTLADLRVTTVRSIRQPVASLSGGQRQSVAVAKAVMWNSKLVM